MLKKRILCVFVLDVSMSMQGQEEHLPYLVNQLIRNLKNIEEANKIIDIAIVEFGNELRTIESLSELSNIKAKLFTAKILENQNTKIGKAINDIYNKILQQPKSNFFFNTYNSKHIILFSDLTYEHICHYNEEYEFVNFINQKASKDEFKLWAVEMGNATDMSALNQTNTPNIVIQRDYEILDSFVDEMAFLVQKIADRNFKYDFDFEKFLQNYIYNPTTNLIRFFTNKKIQKGLWNFIAPPLCIVLMLTILFPYLFKDVTKNDIENKSQMLLASISNSNKSKSKNDNFNLISIESPLISVNNEFNFNFTTNFTTTFDIIQKDTVILSDSLERFALGIYDVKMNKDTRLAFNRIWSFLENIDKNYKINGRIKVEVVGEADAYRMSQNATYNGEYDNIIAKKYYAFSKDSVQFMNLEVKNKIKNNQQLAFLRGYSVWDLMRRHVDMFVRCQTDYKQFIKINDNSNNFGDKYRKVSVKISVQDIQSENYYLFQYAVWFAILFVIITFAIAIYKNFTKRIEKLKKIKINISLWDMVSTSLELE